MKIEVLTVDHLANLDIRPEQTEFEPEEFLAAIGKLEGYAIIEADEVVACAVFVPMHEKVETLIFGFSKNCTTYRSKKALLKAAPFFMNRLKPRQQCFVNKDFEAAATFVEHFGFVKEGLLKSFNKDGTDVYIYGRVR